MARSRDRVGFRVRVRVRVRVTRTAVTKAVLANRNPLDCGPRIIFPPCQKCILRVRVRVGVRFSVRVRG
jgi:hypothetical protein